MTPASALTVGDVIAEREVVLSRDSLVRYAGASGDFNPIHQDDEFARAAGMGGVFAHGMLSMGFVGQVVTDWAGAGQVRKLGVRFVGLVRLKDTITCRGRVLAKSSKDDVHLVDLEVWAENDKGDKKALSAWMQDNLVAKLKRTDKKDHDCGTCHGENFDGDFLDKWKK